MLPVQQLQPFRAYLVLKKNFALKTFIRFYATFFSLNFFQMPDKAILAGVPLARINPYKLSMNLMFYFGIFVIS